MKLQVYYVRFADAGNPNHSRALLLRDLPRIAQKHDRASRVNCENIAILKKYLCPPW